MNILSIFAKDETGWKLVFATFEDQVRETLFGPSKNSNSPKP
jgi:hypothetical protein